ncbi:MAG: hypothetical protein K9M36_01870 [Candidatus Pacebacteria bacterium]|nr:hypothetical protein [Candidatus Paceibacterota bacterium]
MSENAPTVPKSEEEISEDAKNKALEKIKKGISVVNIEEIAEAEAKKAADAYMTESKSGAGFIKKLWKHTFFDEYYRQREINKVREEIKNTGNIYTRRSEKSNPDHVAAMGAITERFVSEYEGTLSEGEEKKVLDAKDAKTITAKTNIQDIVQKYAQGLISKEIFINEKNRVLNTLENDDTTKGPNMYADNLLEIAENARLAVEHGASIKELDLETNIILGKAKSSLKTEAHFNMVDRGVDWMKKSKVGRFVSPAVLSTGVGIAYSLSVGMGKKVLGSQAAAWGTFGAAVAVSSAFAGMNESQRVALERAQHGLEMAEGGTFEKDSKRREQINEHQYQMEKSSVLATKLRGLVFEKDAEGNETIKNIKEEEMSAIFAQLASIEARNSLNAKKRIDLISYTDIGSVEKERTDLTILTAKAKVELRKKIEAGLKGGIPEGETFDSYLAKQAKTVEDSLMGGEQGISAKDKAFSRYKAKRVAMKVGATALSGLVIGGVVQEAVAFFKDDTQGIIEGFLKNGGDENRIQTPLEHLRGWIMNDPSTMGLDNPVTTTVDGVTFNTPEGTSIIKNLDGTFDVLKGDVVISDNIKLSFDADGNLDAGSLARLGETGVVANTTHTLIEGTKQVTQTAAEYVETHEGTQHITRDAWYDNDTLIFDKNELRLDWGGGTGIDADGNYVLNMARMTEDGSFHDGFSVDAQEKMKEGTLKMIFSLSQDTQHHVFEVPIDTNGNAVIDPDSEIGKLFFATEDGQAVFKGRFAEVVQSFGEQDGVEHVKPLATLVGENNNNIESIIPTYDDYPVHNLELPLDTEPPYFIPVVPRTPLETLVAKDKKEKGADKKTGGPIIASILTVEGEKEKTDESIKITQEEYQGMQDDLRMINKKIQSSEGIITVTEDDFKSAYGKKRYQELSFIQEGIPVTFNKSEMQVIGDEIEGILSRATVITPEETIVIVPEKEAMSSPERSPDAMKKDIEMLNKKIQSSEGIIMISEGDFSSEYGRNKYQEMKNIPDGTPVVFNKTELDIIATGLEALLIGNQEKEETVEVIKEKSGETAKIGGPIVAPIIVQEKPKASSLEQVFTSADLLKTGTEFEDTKNTYTVTGVKGWIFKDIKVEVKSKETGEVSKDSFGVSDAENAFKKGSITITKII